MKHTQNTPSLWRIATALFVLGSIVYTSAAGAKSGAKKSANNGTDEPDSTDYETDSTDEYADESVLPEYRRVYSENLIIPSGPTFGLIWPVIYSGTAALAIHQALPGQVANPRYQRAMPWLAASYVMNTLFGYYFNQRDRQSIILSNVVTDLDLPAALGLHQALEIGETAVTGPERYLRWPISLYAGWLTVATVVGTPNIFLASDTWDYDADRDEPIAAGLLGATAGLGYAVSRRLNDPVYLIPFVVGFAGIVARQRRNHPLVAGVAGAMAVGLSAVLAYWLPQGNYRKLHPAIEPFDIAANAEDVLGQTPSDSEEDQIGFEDEWPVDEKAFSV